MGQGRYFPANGADRSRRGNSTLEGERTGRISATTRQEPRADGNDARNRARSRPDHPLNYAEYVIRQGDTLSRIAAKRRGLSARDLAWLNRIPVDQPLKVGQRIKLPHQAYLDAGRDAKNRFVALAHYMDRHGGTLPPNATKPPSLASQILESDWRKESRNGYDFHIDAIARPRRVFGQLTFGPIAARSRRNQAQAGKPDRLTSDDGGHFIAARFNGPSDSFNHFAQDASFNRGAYRAIEDRWAGELRTQHRVFVDILPIYHGTSKRPYQLTVTWYVDGTRFRKSFPNEAKGINYGKR
ncbi:MAG: peptidoglycan-binding protein LysM [Sphingobium sp.]|nr:MAG: peptidoglycan-binding protein LysM [Sphingobium sp.]